MTRFVRPAKTLPTFCHKALPHLLEKILLLGSGVSLGLSRAAGWPANRWEPGTPGGWGEGLRKGEERFNITDLGSHSRLSSPWGFFKQTLGFPEIEGN